LFELFLSPPGLKGGHVHFLINADGSFLDERTSLSKGPGGVVARQRNPDWNAEGVTLRTNRGGGRWELEMRVPLAAMGASSWKGTWRANLCRDFKGEGAIRELSSIQKPGAKDFHDHRFYPSLVLTEEAATEPEVEINPIDFQAKPRTLDDRMATICTFGLELASGRILRDVRIDAECYDANGKLHRRTKLFESDRIVYRSTPGGTFEIGFEQVVEAGGVRIALESSEARSERWLRIGGWRGKGELAPAFSDEGALISPCRFPSQVAVEGLAQPVKLVGARSGTIEFRFRPLRDSLPQFLRRLEPYNSRRALFHFGVLRREHPYNYNTSSVVVLHDATNGYLHFTITARGYKGWNIATPFAGEKKWVHVACVWDLDAAPEDKLRLYLDGKRVAEKVRPLKPERIKPETGVDVTPYAIQVGSLNTGRLPAKSAIRDLRLSRTARYDGDFQPPQETRADEETAVIFPFRKSLEGQTVTPEGKRVPLKAEIGVAEYR